MLNNMLKAVYEMLNYRENDVALAFRARVDCAREIVNKLIDATEENPMTIPIIQVKDTTPKQPEKPKGKPGEHKVVVDDGKLVKIENLPLDAMIEVDGKRMTHQQAIGKQFSQGKIL